MNSFTGNSKTSKLRFLILYATFRACAASILHFTAPLISMINNGWWQIKTLIVNLIRISFHDEVTLKKDNLTIKILLIVKIVTIVNFYMQLTLTD